MESKTGLSDTHPDILRLQIELARQAPAWKKLHMVNEMFLTIKQLALVGLRERYPQASEAELQRRLADLLLGPELAEKAYGPIVLSEDVHVD